MKNYNKNTELKDLLVRYGHFEMGKTLQGCNDNQGAKKHYEIVCDILNGDTKQGVLQAAEHNNLYCDTHEKLGDV